MTEKGVIEDALLEKHLNEVSSDSEGDWNDSDEDHSQDEESIKLWNSFYTSDPCNPLTCYTPYESKANNGHDIECVEQQITDNTNRSKYSIQRTVTFSKTVLKYYIPYEDRKGPWEEMARDRYRFRKRILETEQILERCLTNEHRQNIISRYYH